VLAEYSDLEHWAGKEIADMVCQDRSGEMENFLRDYSFNEFPEWSDLSSNEDDEEEIEDSGHASQDLEEDLHCNAAIEEDTQEDPSQDKEYEEGDSGSDGEKSELSHSENSESDSKGGDAEGC
jgi:hypothetical protein